MADLGPQGAKLADVGTDHGQLPVWLIQHGVIPSAVASDLRPAPLARSKMQAERWGVSDRISFRLCDGLNDIQPQEAEVITIAGMGGETIAGILHAAAWTEKSGHCYILQAMSGMDGLRRYLSGHNFVIRQEIIVPEGDTLYVVLFVEPGEMPPLSEGEIWVGRQASDLDSPYRSRYLSQELIKIQRAMAGLQHSQRSADREKYLQFQLAAREVEHMKKEWDLWQQ